ncbi:hypothetical protein GCM10027578_22410 [Spirosoma luteolum]
MSIVSRINDLVAVVVAQIKPLKTKVGSVALTTTDQTLSGAVNELKAGKANNATTLGGYGITDAYTKAQTDTALGGKANNATTLGGYGITDAYTKAQTDTALGGKQNTTDTIAASRLTGLIDAALIPVINMFKPFASTAATIAALSAADQNQIAADGKNGKFNAVTLSDGSTYVYSGGTKNDPASYTLIADTTPDWAFIQNKPASVATAFPDAVTTAFVGPDTDFVAAFNAAMA